MIKISSSIVVHLFTETPSSSVWGIEKNYVGFDKMQTSTYIGYTNSSRYFLGMLGLEK